MARGPWPVARAHWPGDLEPGDLEPGDLEPGDIEAGDIEAGDIEPGDIEAGARPVVRAPWRLGSSASIQVPKLAVFWAFF